MGWWYAIRLIQYYYAMVCDAFDLRLFLNQLTLTRISKDPETICIFCVPNVMKANTGCRFYWTTFKLFGKRESRRVKVDLRSRLYSSNRNKSKIDLTSHQQNDPNSISTDYSGFASTGYPISPFQATKSYSFSFCSLYYSF